MDSTEIVGKLSLLIKRAKLAADLVKRQKKAIRILAHYDADGLTSSSIVIKALRREGKSFHLSNIKQIRNDYIEELKNSKYELIIFLDFGSGSLEKINELEDKDVILIDHHQKQGEPGPRIIFVNPVDFGIGEDISSSGVSYLFARALDPSNKDLSEIAIVGAIGDSQIGSIGKEWGLMGINKEILQDAVETKKIKKTKGLRIWGRGTRPIHKALEYSLDPYIPGVSGSESKAVQFLKEIGIELKKGAEWRTLSDLSTEEEKKLASAIIIERIHSKHENPDWIFGDIYELLDKKKVASTANEFATMVNACGKTGKNYTGIGICVNDLQSLEEVKKILEEYRRELGSGISWIYSNPEATIKKEHANYVLVGSKISEHLISNVISIVSKNQDKVLFGLADADDGVKISSRCGEEDVKKGINLKEIMEASTKMFGCEGGGHKGAAGGTIPKGKEAEFISIAEGLLSSMKSVFLEDSTEKNEEEGKESNINNQTDKDYGSTETTRKGTAGRTKGTESSSSSDSKKMERKGLVQYFGS